MSGSSLSDRASDACPEALRMTVYELGRDASGDPDRRKRRGRVQMLLVLLACAAPVVASYVSYFVLRPQQRSNYATLVQPTRTMPAVEATTLEGTTVSLASQRGQWLLVAVGPAGCDQPCERRLHMQRQLREMLGRDRDRVDKVWLVTDSAALRQPLLDAVRARPEVTVLRVDVADVSTWLEPDAGRRVEDHLYLVDPMGEWMMRLPVDPDPAKVKRDLERLLRASASWDRPGR